MDKRDFACAAFILSNSGVNDFYVIKTKLKPYLVCTETNAFRT